MKIINNSFSKIEKATNGLIVLSLTFLIICSVIWLINIQYSIQIIMFSALSKLALGAIILVTVGIIASEVYVKTPHKMSRLIRKYSFWLLVIISLSFAVVSIYLLLMFMTSFRS